MQARCPTRSVVCWRDPKIQYVDVDVGVSFDVGVGVCFGVGASAS